MIRRPKWSDIIDRDYYFKAEITDDDPWTVRRGSDGNDLQVNGIIPGLTIGNLVWVAAVGSGAAKRLLIVSVEI